jgi:UDP-N-acetylmuramate: L-alanyl-gamma-D-glutamyl-meso-diaminopimelate ligase
MQNIHFIAIGGAAMHNIALSLHAQGYQITGSDDEIFEPSRSRLKEAGILPEKDGWFPEKIHSGLHCVILGMHAKTDNPELLKAQKLGLKILSYPAFLYQQCCNKNRIVIGGSHGKTTITAMVLHAMHKNGKQGDYLVGSQLPGFERMAHFQDSHSWALFEGDEYLASPLDLRPKFHLYQPHLALLSGIAWDHVNVFPSFDLYKEQFSIFLDKMEKNSTLVYNAEDENLCEIVENSNRQDIKFIPYQTPEYRQEGNQFFYLHEGKAYPVGIQGRHNLQNMAGAACIAAEMGMDFAAFLNAMSDFRGAARRMELVEDDKEKNFSLIRDFGHSPSKVKATVNAVREAYAERTFACIFELHTYSSLSPSFIPLYKDVFEGIDRLRIYFSPEALKIKKLPELSRSEVADLLGVSEDLVCDSPEALEAFTQTLTYDNSVLLLMSSGNFGGWKFSTDSLLK